MEKEKWIHDIMQSMKSAEHIDVPASLQQRVQNKIAAQNNAGAKVIAMRRVVVAAAAACILLLLNVWIISKWHEQHQQGAASSAVVYNESLTPDFSIDNN